MCVCVCVCVCVTACVCECYSVVCVWYSMCVYLLVVTKQQTCIKYCVLHSSGCMTLPCGLPIIITPRRVGGGGVKQLVLSVRPSVRPSVCQVSVHSKIGLSRDLQG